jgi:hypothetical protein
MSSKCRSSVKSYTKRNYHGNYVKSLGKELIEVLNP